MKLLGLEAVQNATYYLSRYRQIEDLGGDLYVLNGLGEPDFWPAARYRLVGSKHIDDIVAAQRTDRVVATRAVQRFAVIGPDDHGAVVATLYRDRDCGERLAAKFILDRIADDDHRALT